MLLREGNRQIRAIDVGGDKCCRENWRGVDNEWETALLSQFD